MWLSRPEGHGCFCLFSWVSHWGMQAVVLWGHLSRRDEGLSPASSQQQIAKWTILGADTPATVKPLDQGLANRLPTPTSLLPVFVNKAVLGCGHNHLYRYNPWLLLPLHSGVVATQTVRPTKLTVLVTWPSEEKIADHCCHFNATSWDRNTH